MRRTCKLDDQIVTGLIPRVTVGINDEEDITFERPGAGLEDHSVVCGELMRCNR